MPLVWWTWHTSRNVCLLTRLVMWRIVHASEQCTPVTDQMTRTRLPIQCLKVRDHPKAIKEASTFSPLKIVFSSCTPCALAVSCFMKSFQVLRIQMQIAFNKSRMTVSLRDPKLWYIAFNCMDKPALSSHNWWSMSFRRRVIIHRILLRRSFSFQDRITSVWNFTVVKSVSCVFVLTLLRVSINLCAQSNRFKFRFGLKCFLPSCSIGKWIGLK